MSKLFLGLSLKSDSQMSVGTGKLRAFRADFVMLNGAEDSRRNGVLQAITWLGSENPIVKVSSP